MFRAFAVYPGQAVTAARSRRELCSRRDLPGRILIEIGDIRIRRFPVRVAAPLLGAPAHILPVTHAKQQRSLRSVFVFVQLPGRMHDKGAWNNIDDGVGHPHLAPTFETEIDLGRERVRKWGASRPGSPE